MPDRSGLRVLIRRPNGSGASFAVDENAMTNLERLAPAVPHDATWVVEEVA